MPKFLWIPPASTVAIYVDQLKHLKQIRCLSRLWFGTSRDTENRLGLSWFVSKTWTSVFRIGSRCWKYLLHLLPSWGSLEYEERLTVFINNCNFYILDTLSQDKQITTDRPLKGCWMRYPMGHAKWITVTNCSWSRLLVCWRSVHHHLHCSEHLGWNTSCFIMFHLLVPKSRPFFTDCLT